MELLVVTLAHMMPGRDADGLARVRLISDTMRNAPGLISAHFYRSRGYDTYYVMFAAWEDEEAWKKAQKRYDPKQLLLGSATSLLAHPPEQWFMRYLWGYSRPSALQALAAVHLATIHPAQEERVQRAWIESLRRQVVEPVLAFAFLARESSELQAGSLPQLHQPQFITTPSLLEETSNKQGIIFLNFLSWASETDREAFYSDPDYQAISRFLGSVGVLQVLALDPL